MKELVIAPPGPATPQKIQNEANAPDSLSRQKVSPQCLAGLSQAALATGWSAFNPTYAVRALPDEPI
jgi:hypothetical protein